MSKRNVFILLAAACLLSLPALAQQPSYGAPISLELAKKAAAGAVSEARKLKLSVAISVVDTHGTPVYLEVLDDTMTASPNFALQKARTAATMRRPSKALEDGVAGGRNALLSLPDLLMIEGGEPILVNGKLVGAIGVSGGSSAQDGQIARAGAGMAPAAASDPQAVVQKQLDAYNAHDIRAFMATYDANAEVFEFPAKPVMKGAAQIEEFYATKRFNDPRLRATLDNRIVMGNVVIDYEKITNTQPGGPGRVEAVAIYEVNDGKITKVTLIRGAAVLDKP